MVTISCVHIRSECTQMRVNGGKMHREQDWRDLQKLLKGFSCKMPCLRICQDGCSFCFCSDYSLGDLDNIQASWLLCLNWEAFRAGQWGRGDEAHAACLLQENKLITVDLYPLPTPLPPSAFSTSAICFFYRQVSAELIKPEDSPP